jgi:hypothetical protein
MYVHALLILFAMIKLPCLVSEDHGSNQGCLERTTFSIPGRRGTGGEGIHAYPVVVFVSLNWRGITIAQEGLHICGSEDK